MANQNIALKKNGKHADADAQLPPHYEEFQAWRREKAEREVADALADQAREEADFKAATGNEPTAAIGAAPDVELKGEVHDRSQLEAPLYPYEFVFSMVEDATETLYEWIKRSGAPDTIRQLVDDIGVLYQYHHSVYVGHGKVSRFDNEMIADTVPPALRRIAELDGVFHSAWGASYPRSKQTVKPE